MLFYIRREEKIDSMIISGCALSSGLWNNKKSRPKGRL